MRLRLTVPFHENETVTSFVSRLAQLNGSHFAQDFTGVIIDNIHKIRENQIPRAKEHQRFFPIRSYHDDLMKIKNDMPRIEVARFLSIHPAAFDRLTGKGFLKPSFQAPSMRDLYSREEIEELLESLRTNAQNTAAIDAKKYASIPQASTTYKLSLSEIIGRVLSDRLNNILHDPSKYGLHAIFVERKELMADVNEPTHSHLSKLQVTQNLRVSMLTVIYLINKKSGI